MRGLQGGSGAEADEGDTRTHHLSVTHKVRCLAVCISQTHFDPSGMQRLQLLQSAFLIPEGIQDQMSPVCGCCHTLSRLLAREHMHMKDFQLLFPTSISSA